MLKQRKTENPIIYPESVTLNRAEIELLMENSTWYHDFSPLGFKTPQRPGIGLANQVSKQPILFPMIEKALQLCRQAKNNLRGLELFCADGFFGIYAAQQGAQSVRGVDLNGMELARARLASKILGQDGRTRFEREDVHQLQGEYDFCICAGGLYHLSDPVQLVRSLTQRIHGPLVIQTVVSHAHTEPDYFVTPCPNHNAGSRFSYHWLLRMVKQAGWVIVEATQNELKGNRRARDRGSAYLLCVPPSYVESGLAKPAADAGSEAKQGLWQRWKRSYHTHFRHQRPNQA